MWTAERWDAYYTEQRVYRSEDWTWQALPSSGVLLVVLVNPTGRTFMSGGDWYYMDGGEYGYVSPYPWGSHAPRPDIACQSCVKEGVGVPDDEFKALCDAVLERRA